MKAIRDHFFELILAAISLCFLLLLFAPYWYGYKMQSSYESLISSFGNHTNYTYEVVSFDKGWFSTNADLLIKDDQQNALFYFRHQIIHGPVYLGLLLQGRSPFVNLVVEGYLLPVKNSASFVSSIIKKQPETFKIHASVRMNDDALITVDIPDVAETIENVLYKANGVEFKLEYFADNNRFLGELSIKDAVRQDKQLLEISQLFLNFDQFQKHDTFSGDLVLSFDGLKFRAGEQLLNFRQFSSRIQNDYQENMMDLKVNINASTINLYNEQINTLSADIDIDSINYKLLVEQVESLFDEADNALDYSAFSMISIQPFSFYTEHGGFLANLTLKPLLSDADLNSDIESRYLYDLNVEIGDILFKRIYEILVKGFDVKATEVNLFVDKLLQLNYLESHHNKYLIRLLSKDGKYMINDLMIPISDFDTNISNAFLAN